MEINRKKKQIVKKTDHHSPSIKYTRKEAIKKGGKYAAFTAAATITILSPLKAQGPASTGNGYGGSPYEPPGGNGGDNSPSGDW